MKAQMQKIRVRSLASGDQLAITANNFRGKKANAPSAYLQAAMHGAEVQGSLVLLKLRAYLEKNPPLGDIRIVPFANPMGLNHKDGEYTQGRFDASTGANWNRAYFLPTENFAWESFLSTQKDPKLTVQNFRKALTAKIKEQSKKELNFSQRLALKLQELSIPFDHVLDLHCASDSIRHVYVPEFAKADAAYLGITHQVLIPNDFGGAMDEVIFVPWWTLAQKLGTLPAVQSFTLELGYQERVNEKDADKDLHGILQYLRHRGVLAGRGKSTKVIQVSQQNYQYLHAPTGGLAECIAPLGKRLKKGALLARIFHPNGENAFTEVRAPQACIPVVFHSSAIVHEGAELIKLFLL